MQILPLLLLIGGYQSYAQINFNKKDEWAKIVKTAQASGRHIIVDTYATWCEPCKRMDAEVFTDKKAGDYINANFIAVKVQLDQTASDGEREKAWYDTAREMQEKYQIKAFPTILFFSPDGKLSGRSLGYKNPEQFIDIARNFIEPGKKETDSLSAVYYQTVLSPYLRTYPSWEDVKKKIDSQNGKEQLLKLVIKRFSNGVIQGSSPEILTGAVKELEEKNKMGLNAEMLNSAAFSLSAMTSTPNLQKVAASWSQRIKDENFSYLDTYASILYKLGQKEEAIKLEIQAVEISNSHPAMTEMVGKMKSGGPLFKEFGEKVSGSINVSGHWDLDTAASEFGEIPFRDGAPTSMDITQDTEGIRFLRSMNGQSSNDYLKLVGTPIVQQLNGAEVTRTLTSSVDGSIITVYSDFKVKPKEGDPYSFSREEIYALTNGGSNLLLTRITTTADKIDVIKAFYKK